MLQQFLYLKTVKNVKIQRIAKFIFIILVHSSVRIIMVYMHFFDKNLIYFCITSADN